MKKVYSLLMGLAIIASVASCSEDEEQFTLDTNQTGNLTLSPQSSSFVVTETNQNQLAERFNWDGIELDLPVALTYSVQLDNADGDYSAPVIIAQSSGVDAALTYGQINDAALSLGGENGTPALYKARVVASTTDSSVAPIVSDDVSITITPFVGYPFDPLFLVGAATEPGWDNGSGNNKTNPALYIDLDNNNVYRYTGYFNGDAFKVLSDLGNWQPQYGPRNGAVGVNDGNGSDPDVFSVPSAGYYDFVIDVTGVTNDSEGSSSFSITPNADAATAPTYTSIGILGDAFPDNGFGGPDINFTQSTFDPHKWVIRNLEMGSGDVKFRANDAWDVNWGDDRNSYVGQASMNGPNIPATAGTYDVFFNDLDGRFIFVPVEE
ncbi:SusE domain-containing protein [Nonlabens sp. YIK11]|uniref:SusE domain-containing protein n=1 Tax=Nonlabens sp. YIK11 TaxID=1453349 RepID=UPI0006DC9D57|nr:SusE domain-containing protein [Nonlabens sp. YIK11]